MIVAKVLSILIKTNTDIKEIKISNKEYKITQFADDTTIILDGERDPLQLAFNVLEMFGSVSGLKMNTEKKHRIYLDRPQKIF